MKVTTYLVLLRGINVGGKNNVPMTVLKDCLEKIGFSNVTTYIASGNVMLDSDASPDEVKDAIEKALPETFQLDSELIKVLVLSRRQLKKIVDNKPKGFGDQPALYHSDAIFLMDVVAADVMPIFRPREGVDTVWQGDGVVYSQRLSAKRSKSRLSIIASTPFYKSMTIRSWNTVVKLLEIMTDLGSKGK